MIPSDDTAPRCTVSYTEWRWGGPSLMLKNAAAPASQPTRLARWVTTTRLDI